MPTALCEVGRVTFVPISQMSNSFIIHSLLTVKSGIAVKLREIAQIKCATPVKTVSRQVHGHSIFPMILASLDMYSVDNVK